jgi:HD-GYP domain-containing protein (c-di-GMP phosphodiesterase class II)
VVIDWFPQRRRSASPPDAAEDLARWTGLVNLRRLARSVDDKDAATSGHSERVADLVAAIASELGWPARRAEDLREAARVHDVGKIAVPDEILLTPGPLTPAAYEVVKTHAPVGGQIVATVLAARQVSWIRHHHERWDGRGYPDGLAAHEIPEGAAILCLADAYDAMTHRVYSGGALSEEEARAECRREAGRQFAPWAVDALERAMLRRLEAQFVRSTALAPLRLVTAA